MKKFFSKFKKIESISFHPKLSFSLEILGGLFFVFVANYLIFSWWFVFGWIFFRLLWWFILIYITYYPSNLNKFNHFVFLSINNIGLFLLLLFVEWEFGKYILNTILIVGPALTFWLLPDRNLGLSFVVKPYRRALLILTIAGLFGIWSSVSAIIIFKVFYISKFYLFFIASLITAFASGFWWFFYNKISGKKLLVWSLITLVLMLELSWALYLTPIGFLIFGFLLIWIWYLYWLLVRFHLTTEGIVWKKQIYFLISNLVLFLIFLFFVVKWY